MGKAWEHSSCERHSRDTTFCDVMPSTMDIRKAITTHRDVGGAKMMSHRRGCVGVQAPSYSIFLNIVHNNLQHNKNSQNSTRQIVFPVLNAPEYSL